MVDTIPPPPQDARQRALWLAVRRALLLVIHEIERAYELPSCSR